MSNPESTLQQRLADIVGAAADPFAKVASADPQLDAIAEATFEQAEETVEVPALLQPVEATTEEQPVEAVAKEASVADMAVRDIVTNEHFQAGFHNAYAQRAGEIEDAIEKIAFLSKKTLKRSFRSGAGSGALVGAGLGAGVNALRVAKQNRENPDQPKQSVIGGALKGAAGGAAAGAAANTALQYSDRVGRAKQLAFAKKKRAKKEARQASRQAMKDTVSGVVGRAREMHGKMRDQFVDKASAGISGVSGFVGRQAGRAVGAAKKAFRPMTPAK